MMCYRDITFCAAKCLEHRCGRQVTPAVEAGSKRTGLPLALSDFSKTCPDYKPAPRAEEGKP